MSTRISHEFQHLQAPRLDDGDDLRAAYAREAFAELIDGLTTFQSVDEILQWHTRSGEHRGAAHDFRVGMNDALKILEVHGERLPPSLPGRERQNRAFARRSASVIPRQV